MAAGALLAAWPGVTLFVVSQLAGWAIALTGFARVSELVADGRGSSLSVVPAVGTGAVGVTLAVWPRPTVLAATLLVGCWLVFEGGSRVLRTLEAESPRHEVVGNLLGALEVVAGVAVIARPVQGVRAAAVLVAVGLVVHGAALVLRGWPAAGPRVPADSSR